MDDFLKMDVFFVVATTSTVLVAALASVVLWRINRILRTVEHVAEQVSEESEEIRKDLDEVRKSVRAGKNSLKSLLSFATGLGKRRKRSE